MTEQLRTKCKTIIRSVACISAVAIFGGVASASIATSTCVALTGPTDLNGNVSCPTFDNTLGTLTSIELDFTGETSGTVTLTNNNSTTQTFTVTETTVFDLGALSGFTAGPILTTVASTAPTTLAGGATSSPLPVDSGPVPGVSTDSTILSPYIGDGIITFDVPITTSTGQTVTGGGGNATVTLMTNGNIGADVTYTYTAATAGVPEPTTLGLIGGGLVGIGLISRRKRVNKAA